MFDMGSFLLSYSAPLRAGYTSAYFGSTFSTNKIPIFVYPFNGMLGVRECYPANNTVDIPKPMLSVFVGVVASLF